MPPLDPLVHGAPVLLRHLPEGPLQGAEIGILRGKNAAHLLERRPQLLLHLVDNWNVGPPFGPAEIRSEARERLRPYVDRIIWHETDSIYASLSFADQQLDFVYLDGDHSGAYLLDEIEAWEGIIKPGGILSGHDYGHPDYPGVRAAVDVRARGCDWDVTVEERTWLVRL